MYQAYSFDREESILAILGSNMTIFEKNIPFTKNLWLLLSKRYLLIPYNGGVS